MPNERPFLTSTLQTVAPFPWQGVSGKGYVVNYVWNSSTLALEIQSSSSGGGTSDATAANQVTGNASLSSIDTNQGAKADAAATTDTGTFSLIALVKRLLQSLTSGNVSTASLDGKVFSQKVSVSSCTNVNGAASTTSLLASTAGRRAAYFFNDSASDLFLKFGATASTTSFTVKIGPYGFYEMPVNPVYTGAVDGIWTTATGAVRITELS